MRERPILFSTPMIKAILENRKTQTRRTVKHKYSVLLNDPYYATGKVLTDLPKQPGAFMEYRYEGQPDEYASFLVPCPFGKIGDHLWVRETFLPRASGKAALYKADYDECEAAGLAGMYSDKGCWKPSIFMPRELSRITLEITKIRVEKLHEIKPQDALNEGIEYERHGYGLGDPCDEIRMIQSYQDLWESINGKGSWDLNPWVWVIEFRRVS